MGDYQARFCERFGGAIPPYLLDHPPYSNHTDAKALEVCR
jgi:hypothetical protein